MYSNATLVTGSEGTHAWCRCLGHDWSSEGGCKENGNAVTVVIGNWCNNGRLMCLRKVWTGITSFMVT